MLCFMYDTKRSLMMRLQFWSPSSLLILPGLPWLGEVDHVLTQASTTKLGYGNEKMKKITVFGLFALNLYYLFKYHWCTTYFRTYACIHEYKWVFIVMYQFYL